MAVAVHCKQHGLRSTYHPMKIDQNSHLCMRLPGTTAQTAYGTAGERVLTLVLALLVVEGVGEGVMLQQGVDLHGQQRFGSVHRGGAHRASWQWVRREGLRHWPGQPSLQHLCAADARFEAEMAWMPVRDEVHG